MRCLVLGGSRFIGLRLVKLLVEAGDEVTTLNRGTREQPHAVERLVADRRNARAVKNVLRGNEFDAAFDISAYAPSETGPVTEALEGHVDRFVHISTAAVYGREGDMPFREESPRVTKPDWSRYARDKIACEDLLLEAHEARGFPAVILRPPYVYGPENYLYREAYFYDRAEAGRPIPVPEGEAKVNFVHVDDLAGAFREGATRKGVEGSAFNVASKEALSFGDFAGLVGMAVGEEAVPVAVAASRLKSLFPFGNLSILLDTARARETLGWRPRSMERGLRDTFSWYREHRPFGPPEFAKDDEILDADR